MNGFGNIKLKCLKYGAINMLRTAKTCMLNAKRVTTKKNMALKSR